MALITDPDNLSQGSSTAVTLMTFAAGTGADIQINSGTNNQLPALAVGEFFEVRDHSVAGNNGLYKVVTINTSTDSYECDKITGIAPVTAAAEAATTLGATGLSTEKSVHFDTDTKLIYLLEQGNLSADGVTMLAFHSFCKEEWKQDDLLISAAAFPMVGISFAAGQWQFGTDPSGNNSGWKPAEDDATNSIFTRQLFRNAGWDEIDQNGNTIQKYFNVTTLGDFNAGTDQAYYRFGSDATDLTAAVNYVYTDKVNEPVKYFEEIGNPDTFTFVDGGGGSDTVTRGTGSFITDGFQVGGQMTVRNATTTANNGTYVITGVAATTLTFATGSFNTGEADASAQIAVDNSNAFTTYLRIEGKTFSQADLTSAGETAISSKIIKFPLANSADVDIVKADPVTGSPYDDIVIRYFDQPYSREVDGATNRLFGIVIDVGTHSGVDGSFSAAGTVLTTSEGGMGVNAYQGGSLRINEGTDENLEFTIASNTATTITISGGTFTATESNISFVAQRATPVTASKQEIYEKIQYQLRQAADIDATDQVVNGKTADALLNFIGPDLQCGEFIPTNPNGGGSGVIIEGFDSNDTNNLFFYDNVGTRYNYPFVAAGTITFSQTLVDDTDGEYWLYYDRTVRTTSADIDVVSPSGSTYDLEGTLGTYAVGDYLRISGFVQEANNGLFIVEAVNVSGSDYTVRKIDGSAVGTAETNVTVNVDEHPYPSPDAIVVQNNSGVDIKGAINSLSVSFDYDYDNNPQGGRTAPSVADVVLVAAGFETAQVAVVKNLQITRATGLSFSVTAPLERNAENPA
jgi:hypothetical protein